MSDEIESTKESVESGATEEVAVSSEEATVAERPDYIEEKFWDAETGSVNTENMAKSYKDLQTAYLKKTENLKEEVAADFAKERVAARPETADKYEVRIAEDAIPEGVEFKFIEDDPLLAEFRTLAFDNGLSQEQFDSIISKYAQSELGKLPNEANEIKALGERGPERIERINAWLGGLEFPNDSMDAIHQIARTANGIAALEVLQAAATGESLKAEDTPTIPEHVADREQFEAETKAMMRKPEYFRDHDPSIVREVEERFKILYPGSSPTAAMNRM